jgi:hypothetical protein
MGARETTLLENFMQKSLTFAAAILCAAIPLSAAAQATTEQNSDPQRPPRSGSLKQDIKNDAHEVKKEVKSTARKTKRALAVAECNDGRYSYTHHKTCNHHGGVKTQLR